MSSVRVGSSLNAFPKIIQPCAGCAGAGTDATVSLSLEDALGVVTNHHELTDGLEHSDVYVALFVLRSFFDVY